MKLGLTIIFYFSVLGYLFAQDFEWAKNIGGVSNETAAGTVTDVNGNVYTVGTFFGTVDFDPGAGTFNLSTSGSFMAATFIQKLDASGNFVWAKSTEGAGACLGYDIAVDTNGNVYTTGFFSGTVDFNPGGGVFSLASSGTNDRDIFVQKLDANGNFTWAKSVGGSNDDEARNISTDANGNVYITGVFHNTVDFDPSTGIFNLTSNGAIDVFILKLNASGNLVWVKSVGSTGSDYAYDIEIDQNNNIYTTGYFYNTIDLDPNSSTFNLTSNGGTDAFIQKLDMNGNFIWAKSMGSAGSEVGYNIVSDNNGNIYTTGAFIGTVDFNPNNDTFYLTSTGYQAAYIQKLDANGSFVWAKKLDGNTNGDSVFDPYITVDNNSNIYIIGNFRGVIDIDPDTAIVNLTSVIGTVDIFIQKLNSNGNFIWSRQIGGTNDSRTRATNIDLDNNIYIAGYFDNSNDFNPNAGVYNLTSNGNNDGFILKLSQCSPNTGTDTQTACSAYTWIDGNIYTSSNNTATYILTNIAGCDSIVTLDLTIQATNTLPYQEDFTGTFPPLNTSIINPDNSTTWIGGVWTATNGATNDVMYLEYSAYNAVGQKDYLVLPLLDLDTVTIAELSFDVSYNPYSAQYSDTLVVEVSIDCGLTYQPIYTKGGLDLSIDNSYVTSVWVPDNAADWRKERINLSPYLGNNALLRIVGVNGYGNNLYLDNLNIGLPVMTNIAEIPSTEIIKVYPIPAKDDLTLELLKNSQDIQLEIVDVNGRVVLSKQYQEQKQIQVSVEHLTTGVYFVKINSSKGLQTVKMLKE